MYITLNICICVNYDTWLYTLNVQGKVCLNFFVTVVRLMCVFNNYPSKVLNY